MSTFKAILNEILALFVDDGSMAFAILAVVGATAFLKIYLDASPLTVGATLLAGCVIVLVENTIRTGRRK